MINFTNCATGFCSTHQENVLASPAHFFAAMCLCNKKGEDKRYVYCDPRSNSAKTKTKKILLLPLKLSTPEETFFSEIL
jgi:hypothetical protein